MWFIFFQISDFLQWQFIGIVQKQKKTTKNYLWKTSQTVFKITEKIDKRTINVKINKQEQTITV